MRPTLLAAGIELALVAFWLSMFWGAIGTPHQQWYLEIPLLFLVVPVIAIAAAIKLGRAIDDRRFGIYLMLLFLLAGNLAASFIYAIHSGGGV